MDAAICQICNGGLCEDGNEILFCDGEKWGGPCGVAVHQQCYYLGELPSGDWLCDACAPQQHDPSAADGTMVRCELCEGTSYREGGRWQSFPLMRCRPPSCEKAGFIHAACAASFPQIFREESLGGAWVWDEEGQAIIDKLRKLKQPCYLCEERGGASCSVGTAPRSPGASGRSIPSVRRCSGWCVQSRGRATRSAPFVAWPTYPPPSSMTRMTWRSQPRGGRSGTKSCSRSLGRWPISSRLCSRRCTTIRSAASR